MNPLTNVKNITKLNEIELSRGLTNKTSWHNIYKGSAWIFIGGLAYGMTEGDIVIVFSQFGEIVNINMVRDKKTGKTKGFCFLCYANQQSTILAVDNLNGIKLCQRTIRVDHVADYKPPKEHENDDIITRTLQLEGCAPKPIQVSAEDEVQILPTPLKKIKKEDILSRKREGLQWLSMDVKNQMNEQSSFQKLEKRKKSKKHKKHSRNDSSSESDEAERHSSKVPKTSDSSRCENHTSNELPSTSGNNFSTNFKSSSKTTKGRHSEKQINADSTPYERHHQKHKSKKKRHHSDSDSYRSSSDVDLKRRKEKSKRESQKEYEREKADRNQHTKDYRLHTSSKSGRDRT